jgi:hypothetical protein
LAALLVAGVNEELDGVDQRHMVDARDDLLATLLEHKRRHIGLP